MAVLIQAELGLLGQSEGHREASFSSVEGFPSYYNLAAVEELLPAAASTLSLELCRLDLERALRSCWAVIPGCQHLRVTR